MPRTDKSPQGYARALSAPATISCVSRSGVGRSRFERTQFRGILASMPSVVRFVRQPEAIAGAARGRSLPWKEAALDLARLLGTDEPDGIW